MSLLSACSDNPSAPARGPGTPTYQLLRQDVIIDADMWDTEPRMMAAGLGFTGIIGVPAST